MCGIIAVLRRRSRRAAPSAADVETPIEQAAAIALDPAAPSLAASLDEASAALESADKLLFGTPGIRCIQQESGLAQRIVTLLGSIEAKLDNCERELDNAGHDSKTLETINASVIRLRDAHWAILHDRLDTAEAVITLAGSEPTDAALDACFAIQSALSSLDRLEVRGRDSAGLHILITEHGIADSDPALREALSKRASDSGFRSLSFRQVDGGKALSFAYKRAAEIGELGDNVAALRAAIAGDALLHQALRNEDAVASVLGHTRWASVGIISESNAHPLNSEETGEDGRAQPYTLGVLNGDVDNHRALVEQHKLAIDDDITTDAKVIPVLMSRGLERGDDLVEAFRSTVQSFEGSVAIGAAAAATPDLQVFALRGSGQALYIGVAEDTFVVASEPYGVTEITGRYLRMDGETPGNPDNPTGSRGQIVALSRSKAGDLDGIQRIAYDGTALPVTQADLTPAPVTTRDVDRGSYAHFLLKEISEAPRSFQKTLRGRIVDDGGSLRVKLGDDTLPPEVRKNLRDGKFRRILVIGQGTAAVAGHGALAALRTALANSAIECRATPATELSGFEMGADMSDTLILAISQSGTTTDTNRTVDLVRGRGAKVIAIVNRRGSDLTDKADGVLYTSDGRDVEMSVASTKAFYAQVAAGFLFAFAVAEEVGCADRSTEHEILSGLRRMPDAMRRVLENRKPIHEAATEHATRRRYWAIVGNGNNKIAASEIRIKLSELCYKSIACDATEDKKHIDLSAEPMILVCAAGLRGSTADDVAKEVAIYAAHQSIPIVIATEGEERFSSASHTIAVPHVHTELDFVLSAVVGHLFGYEAALAIDALALPLREARAAIEECARGEGGEDDFHMLEALAPALVASSEMFYEHLRSGDLDGQLEASTATQLTSLLRYALGIAPLETFPIEHGEMGTPANVIEKLTSSLTDAIEQLTRPVDAIKHQAKTVTVGISRSDETLINEPLVRALLEAGVQRESLTYAELQALAALSPTVSTIAGFSRYAVDTDAHGDGTIRQIDAGGIAANLPSRTGDNPTLKGTKHRVARERNLLVARGESDNRTVILVPEFDGVQTTGITLLHVEFLERAGAAVLRSALQAYRDRWSKLEETITETESEMRLDALEDISVIDCLVAPIEELAATLRSAKSAS